MVFAPNDNKGLASPSRKILTNNSLNLDFAAIKSSWRSKKKAQSHKDFGLLVTTNDRWRVRAPQATARTIRRYQTLVPLLLVLGSHCHCYHCHCHYHSAGFNSRIWRGDKEG